MSVMESREAKELAMTYRRTFGTPDGKAVLRDILSELGHFSSAENEADVTLQNFAKLLLYKLGAFLDHNEEALVDQYVSLPIEAPVESRREGEQRNG